MFGELTVIITILERSAATWTLDRSVNFAHTLILWCVSEPNCCKKSENLCKTVALYYLRCRYQTYKCVDFYKLFSKVTHCCRSLAFSFVQNCTVCKCYLWNFVIYN